MHPKARPFIRPLPRFRLFRVYQEAMDLTSCLFFCSWVGFGFFVPLRKSKVVNSAMVRGPMWYRRGFGVVVDWLPTRRRLSPGVINTLFIKDSWSHAPFDWGKENA